MASLAQLVESPALRTTLGYVVRARTQAPVSLVALVEDLDDIERVDEQAIVLLTRSASAYASTYRFDVALRIARARKVAAIVLTGAEVASITPTAAAIADRSGMAILATGSRADLAQLAVGIARELAGGAEAALVRAHTAVRAIEAHPTDGATQQLLEHAGAALSVPLSMTDTEPPAGPKTPIRIDDRVAGWLTAPATQGHLGMALDIVLRSAAWRVGQTLASADHAEELPIQSREEVLTELLSAPPEVRPELVLRARQLGLAIDGWHVATRLELEELVDAPDDALAGYEARVHVARSALQAARKGGGSWDSARTGTAILLLRTYRQDPGVAAAGDVAKAMDVVLHALRPQLPATLMRCGVGGAHVGPDGILSSAAEAKAAVTSARASGRPNEAVPFDSVGLRRTLVEWYASDTAQEAMTTILSPLVDLGGARAERLIQTLHVYLDQRGSLTRTAETLNMHRNAVAYRINQVFSLLDVDQDNADDLLLLQLACRARELA
jgi:sugar diacid utilization regulator